MNPQTFIFIGRSGCGKGLQSSLLRKFLNQNDPNTPVVYVETGDHFREYIKSPGYTWERARAVNDNGELQPDFLAVWVWSQVLIEKMGGNQHLVFDGSPRSLVEAKILHTAIPFYERSNPVVVFIDVSHEWAEERLRGRGRADDVNLQVVERRLSWYEKDVLPAINFYKENSMYKFLRINGEQTPEEIHKEILKGAGLVK